MIDAERSAVKFQLSLVIALAAAGLPHLQAAGVLYGATTYNVFVFQNFTDLNSDIQGGLAAGGTASLSSFTVGNTIGSLAPFAPFGGYTLIGAGNLIASNGSLVHGNAYDGTAGGLSSFTVDAGTVTSGGTEPVDFSTDASGIKSYSSSTLANSGQSNGTGGDSCSLGGGNVLTCNATQNGLNTIYLSGATLAAATGGLIVNSSKSGATIVFDVTGTSDALTSGGWTFSGISAQNILLNFFQATALNFEGSVPVSVLAPYAAVTGNNGVLTGNLISTSFTSTYGYQFNSDNFNGTLPGMTPEPASILLVIGGFLVALAAGRKRTITR
jgi:choice-of-anchor A domain-containing protein